MKTPAGIDAFTSHYCNALPNDNTDQHTASNDFMEIADKTKGLGKQVDLLYKLAMRAIDCAEKKVQAKQNDTWDNRTVARLKKKLDRLRKDALEQLQSARYFHLQMQWLQSRFPEAELADVEGLVKLVDQAEIEANDWSLSPGRYVGVTPIEEDEGFDFKAAIQDIHMELAGLNEEAIELARMIQANFEELEI